MHLTPLLLLWFACQPAPPEVSDTAPDVVLSPPISADTLRPHLQALQAVADAHGGHRSAGSPGDEASLQLVEATLADWGYLTTREPVSFARFRELGPGALAVVDAEAFTPQVDFATFGYSPAGDVTAPITAVDLVAPTGPPDSSDSGCDEADWDGFPAGHIALLQRGSCPFQLKLTRAQAAGAVAAVVFNEGQQGRTGVEAVTLQYDPELTLPAVFASYATGQALLARVGTDARVRVAADTLIEPVETYNLFATLPGERAEAVMVGAHLDSVPEGPGINDNGTGVAMTLELARRFSQGDATVRSVRFAFWGAEEFGLLGSLAHVDAIDSAQLTGLGLYLNLDMVGSPNGFRFLLNARAEASALGLPANADSIAAEAELADWFTSQGLPFATTPMLGRSDHAAFLLQGVPVAALFTGANETALTADQAASTGGEVGEPHDACYHQACDTLDNVDLALLAELAAGAEHLLRARASAPPQPDRARPPQRRLPRVPYLTHDALQ